MRALALIDGEHYPPVVRTALETLAADYQFAAAVFIGGTEKVDSEGSAAYGVSLVRADSVEAAIRTAIERHDPDVVVDLSDEPVVSAADRMRLASLVLSLGVDYRGADFEFRAPRPGAVTVTPTLGVIGTGKRVGKTAVSAHVARVLKAAGRDVVVLAMGRGGPAEPEVIHGESVSLSTADLLALARQGKHASSDNYEDAVMSRVTTVGCRRCGGGMAGETFVSNVPEGALVADGLAKELIILEGSGAAIPPVHADASIIVVPAGKGTGYVTDFFGPYRFARADLAVIAFAEHPIASADEIAAIRQAIAAVRPDLPVIATKFRPAPVADISGARVLFATTADPQIAGHLAVHLEAEYGCEVAAVTTHLSNRAALREELVRHAGTFDLIVSELKAAAIDVVAAEGEALGIRTVLCDNVPMAVDGTDLDEAIISVATAALERGTMRKGARS